ncbi:MAG: glutathione S-transferase, partial [Nevskia sp.]|nr:glutathione S-transferase [Nevskia sp.]
MKLYRFPLSGHSHRAELFLSLLGVEHQLVDVDLSQGAHKAPEFLALNPFGQVPVLDDEGVIVSDSNAILVYLAKKYGRTDWLPEAPQAAAAVQRWLSVAAGELKQGPATARAAVLFGVRINVDEVMAR